MKFLRDDMTELVIDWWYDEEEIRNVTIFDRTCNEPDDGEWGQEIGSLTLSDTFNADDLCISLERLGWVKGDTVPYTIGPDSGSVTHWSRA